jgi:histo-blood group ABO system transferase
MNVGLIIIATQKYIEFVPRLLESIEKFFLKGHDVEIFLFTDCQFSGNVTIIPTQHKPWPWMTLGRYHLIQQLKNYPQKDFYYYIDADMALLDSVGDEIFGERVAAIHGKFKKKPGNYDRNPQSLAYISEQEISKNALAPYYCGGFQGGSNYLDDAAELARRIDIDDKNSVMAAWHDESHWNRYLLDVPPTIVLSDAYCSQKEKNAKILIVKKNVDEVR